MDTLNNLTGKGMRTGDRSATLFRVAIFVFYAICALYMHIQFTYMDAKDQTYCHVKHTYRTELASMFLSNPIYTSTQIWRNPPPALPEIETGKWPYDQQRAGDIGVFPVVIDDASNRAAFVEGIWIPKEPDFDLFGNDTHARVKTNNTETDEYVVLLRNGIDPATGEVPGWFKERYEDGNNTEGLTQWQSVMNFRKFMKDARVVTSDGSTVDPTLQTHLFEEQFYRITNGKSILPNYERCVKVTTQNKDWEKLEEDEKKKIKPEEETKRMKEGLEAYYRELQKYYDHSMYRGVCAMNGLQQMVDIRSNFKTNLSPLSSISLHYIPQVIFWVAASFVLLEISIGTLDNTTKFLGGNIPYFSYMFAFAWNVVGIVIAMVYGVTASHHIPVNNLVIGMGVFLATIMVLLSYENLFVKNRVGPNVDMSKRTGPVDDGSNNSRAGLFGNALRMRGPMHTGAQIRHESENVEAHDIAYENGHPVLVFQSLQYIIVSPLLYSYCVIVYSDHELPTGNIQLFAVCVFASRVAIAALFKMQAMLKKRIIGQKYQVSEVNAAQWSDLRLRLTEGFLFVYLTVVFLAVIYFWAVVNIFNSNGSMANFPGEVATIFILDLVAVLGVGVYIFMDAMGFAVDNAIFAYPAIVSLFDLLYKILFFVLVVQSANNPHAMSGVHGCRMWASLQGPFVESA